MLRFYNSALIKSNKSLMNGDNVQAVEYTVYCRNLFFSSIDINRILFRFTSLFFTIIDIYFLFS